MMAATVLDNLWSMTVHLSGPAAFDAIEVRRALALLVEPGTCHELRGLPSGRSLLICGDDLDAAVERAGQLADDRGVYVTLNPVRPDLGDRAARNADILIRRWLLIDCDPVKADPDGNATAEEKEAARELMWAVEVYLTNKGWPAPIIIDSGNGFHLLYRVDLPNDSLAKAWLAGCLKALATLHDTDLAKIDRKVHNSARITKLPGTWARKGPDTIERPHRLAGILEVPETLQPVSNELLASLAGLVARPANGAADTAWTIPIESDNARAYYRAALAGEVGKVATTSRLRNDQLNDSACKLGGYVAGGYLDRAEVERQLTAAARVAGLEEGETRRTIKSGLDAGMETPKSAPTDKAKGKGTQQQTTPPPLTDMEWEVTIDGEIVASGTPSEFLPETRAASGSLSHAFHFHTLSGLMCQEFPEPIWVVPGLLSEGLNILAGKPKMGKSMMALNLGITVAAGGIALGNTPTTAGDVLYISLEDRGRRLQSRARKMLRHADYAISSRLTLATTWPRQGAGGLELIEWWMQRVERPALVIIDVWGKFRPPGNPKANQYTQDYEHMAPLKDLMDRYTCSGLGLMHMRKGESDDIVDDISGTLGLAGAADGLIVLQRSRSDNEAKIFVTGRDVPDTELALQFDPETLTWKSLGSAEEHVTGKLQAAIIDYLRGLGGTGAFAPDIALALNEDKDSVRATLHKMYKKRLIRHVGNSWAYPGEDTPEGRAEW